jgi:hypothetical protein
MSEPFGHVRTKETANTIKGSQYALFLNLKNPLETPDFVHESVSSMLSELYKQGIISREKYSSLRGISNSELRNLMLSLGYDGTKYENKAERGGISYSFITPNQIKSATDNVGTFSKTNDNIYKRRGEKRDNHMYNRERAVKYIKDQGYTIDNLVHDTYETRFEVTLKAKTKEDVWRSYIKNMDPALKVKYAGVRIGKKDPRLEV